MKYIYLVNRFNLHNKTENIISCLQKASLKHQRDYEIIVNETADQAFHCVEPFKDGEYVITSIGGDGSLNLLLNELVDTRNVLAFIPYGTGNDFYRYCKENLSTGIYESDIARINERYFINEACFGIDADIANNDNFIHNRLIPAGMRYNLGILYHFLTFRPRRLKIQSEEVNIEKEVTTVVVGNAQYYGGGYHVTPDSDITDGRLELLIADRLNKPAMARVILSMSNASHLKNPAVSSFTTRKVTITAAEPISANIDGEPLLADRFEIEIIPKGIRLEYDKEFIEDFLHI